MRTYSCFKLPMTKSWATLFRLYCDSHLIFNNCSFRGQKPLPTSQAGSNPDFPWSEAQCLLFLLRNSHLFGIYFPNIYCVPGTVLQSENRRCTGCYTSHTSLTSGLLSTFPDLELSVLSWDPLPASVNSLPRHIVRGIFVAWSPAPHHHLLFSEKQKIKKKKTWKPFFLILNILCSL